MSERPTPETDSVAEKINFGVDIDFARKLERERDEAREVLERIVKLSIHARCVEEDYAEWEKAVFAILDICEKRKEK
jgi:hypothetical protein